MRTRTDKAVVKMREVARCLVVTVPRCLNLPFKKGDDMTLSKNEDGSVRLEKGDKR